MRSRLTREEDGFTLAEVLVTMVLMILVLFALYSIFDMSIRVFSFGNDKVEATENARIGLAKMEREVRAAYPYDKVANPEAGEKLLNAFTPTQITFGNDLNGNRRVDTECPTDPPPACEEITYRVYQTGAGPYALGRANSATGTLQPVVESIDYAGSSNTGVEFSYLKWDSSSGNFVSTSNENEVEMVRISVRVKVDGATQRLSTDVALRNRST